jgi:prepilin-type N-terminal cleavage/methylation domain-containing protein
MNAPTSPKVTRGFTLVETMVATALLVIVMSGVTGLYVAHRNARVAEELSQTVEAQLRLGMDKLLFRLRNAPYGVPWGEDLTVWVTWTSSLIVSGSSPPVATNPNITAGADASTPDTVSVAGCSSKPVASLAADTVANATAYTVDNGAEFDNSSRSVIMINDSEPFKIVSTSGNTINVDHNPDETEDPGPTGVSKIYRIGTPICRVGVVTYSVDTATSTLREDLNHGAGPQVIVDGITNMKITTDTTGTAPKYTITLTARASATDPLTTTVAQRSLTSIATARINN